MAASPAGCQPIMDVAENPMPLSNTGSVRAKKAQEALIGMGIELKRLRVRRSERLEDIAAYLSVKSAHLYGLEQGDLSSMASVHEVRSMTSSYASYLGLEDEKIIRRMNPILDALEAENAPATAGLDKVSAVILSTSVLFGVIVGWSLLGEVAKVDLIAAPITADAAPETPADDASIDENTTTDIEPLADVELPDSNTLLSEETASFAAEAEKALANLQELTRTEQRRSDETLPPASVEPPVEVASLTVGQPPEASAAAAVASNASVRSVAPPPDNSASPRGEERPANVLATLVAKQGGAETFEPQNTDARVIVRALSTSWVQVSSRDRSYLWTRTMQPREMLLVPSRDDLELWAGDASGVEVLLDGKILPPLGPEGTVIRGLSLAPLSLEAIATAAAPQGADKPTF